MDQFTEEDRLILEFCKRNGINHHVNTHERGASILFDVREVSYLQLVALKELTVNIKKKRDGE